MLSDYISPGNRIELTTTNASDIRKENNGDENATRGRIYRSKLYDIRSEEEIEIVMPMDKGKLQLLSIGGEFDLCFYTASGLYQCYGVVRDR